MAVRAVVAALSVGEADLDRQAMQMKKRSRRLVVAVISLCCVVAACSTEKSVPTEALAPAATAALRPTSETSVATLDAKRASEITDALGSRDPNRLRPLLATNLQPEAERIAVEAVPAGAAVTVDPASVVALSAGSARADGSVVVDGTTSEFVFLFVQEGGNWRLAGTAGRGEVP